APRRSVRRSTARQRRRPNAEIDGERASWRPPVSRAYRARVSSPLSRASAKIHRAALAEQCYVLIRPYQSCNGAEMQVSDRIGLRLKLHDLHVLMAVVQAGNMSKAAALLNTTQPAISRSIAELERTIGVRLLDRNPQGVELTEYGRVLLDGGAAVFDELRQTVKNIKFLADPTAGEIRIGCGNIQGASFVSAVIHRISRQYPHIAFHIVSGYVEPLHRELSERNVDLLFAVRLGALVDERLEFDCLFDDQYVVVAGTQSRWARRRKIELAELMNEPWVLPPPGSVGALLALDAFRANGLDFPRRIVVTESSVARFNLPATGSFLTIFP